MFASPWTKVKQPLWPDSLLKHWIQPVAKRVGITKRLEWHTFRHTYSTLLRANSEDVKVVQELLRHANSKITMDIYHPGALAGQARSAGPGGQHHLS